MKSLSNRILSILKSVSKNKKTFLHEPYFTKSDLKNLTMCFKSGMISTAGKYTNLFEKQIKRITNCKYVISVTNGTVGLFLSLKILGIKKNDEVLVPAVTFVATANAVAHCDAIPHFVDIEKTNFGIDVKNLESYLKKNTIIKNHRCINKKTKRIIRAIIPVHVFGHPCDMEKIIKISKKYNLIILEDATEALGSFYKNKHVGNFGKIGVFSFNGNKIVTTGGGGAIVTNNKKLAKKIKHLSSTAKIKHKWRYIHDEIGYNYRLPAINSSIGYSQLINFKKNISLKNKIYEMYEKKFSKLSEVALVKSPKNCKSNYWLQTLYLKNGSDKLKNETIKECHKNKIYVRPLWDLLPSLKMYRNCPKMKLENSKIAYYSAINLPSSSNIIK